MAKCKYQFINNDHPYGRLKERTSRPISPKKINESLSKNQGTFAKRTTNTRSIVYLKVDDIPLKIVVARNNNKVVTILPINYLYELEEVTVELDDKMYKIKIFPDCYYETENPRIMTQFWIKTENGWQKARMKKHPFEYIFNLVWNVYKECFFRKEEMQTYLTMENDYEKETEEKTA